MPNESCAIIRCFNHTKKLNKIKKQICTDHPGKTKAGRSAVQQDVATAPFDEVDNVISPAGVLMRSELNNKNDILDEVDFEKLQRLEEKDIFVTQGDLMNLWFILSKRNNKSINKDEKDGKPAREDLNAMADMLLDSKNAPDTVDSPKAGIRDYTKTDRTARRDSAEEKFVLATDEEPMHQLLLPGLDDYVGSEYFTLATIKLHINELSVKLQSAGSDYLTARITDLSGHASRTNCCVCFRVTMNSITLSDHLHKDVDQQTLRIAYSPQSSSMATLEARFIDDVTKVRLTHVSKAITFTVATLKLCINDTSTIAMMKILNKISNRLAILNRTRDPGRSVRVQAPPRSSAISDSTSMTSRHTALTEADVFYDASNVFDTASLTSKRSTDSKASRSSQKRSSRRRRKNKAHRNAADVEIVECDIRCSMSSLSVDLQQDRNIIAKLDICNMCADFEQRLTGWTMEAKLGAMSLTDPLASIYSQVLVVEDGKKEVMTFHMTNYDQSVQRNRSCDQSIKVKLRRIRLVYVNKYFTRLLNFFGVFSSPSTVDKINETSRHKLSNSAKSAHNKGSKVKILVEAKTPLITVPVSESSHDALLLILGDLNASNEFVSEWIPEKQINTEQIYDKMTVSLTNIAIERILYINERKCKTMRSLLTPVTTSVTLTRALAPISKKCVEINVQADINQFVLEISQLDMQMMGKVLYENILVSDTKPESYDVTDVGSTISSALSSTASSTGASASNSFVMNLNLGGLRVNLKSEKQSEQNALECVTENLAAMDIAELKIDLTMAKKDWYMSCNVSLRNFNIYDLQETGVEEFKTNSVIQLDDTADQVLQVKVSMDTTGNQAYDVSVEKMRFNVNMPFVKSMLTFLQESFITWKSADPPPPPPALSRARLAPPQARRRKVNVMRRTTARLSVSRRTSVRPGRLIVPATKITKMTFNLKFGKQSLYIISGDRNFKALVAEVNLCGKACMESEGRIDAEFMLKEMSVYTTSLRIEEVHLKHQCLEPCEISAKYSRVPPPAYLRENVPPKEDVEIKMTKIDIKLSTNVIYHAFDALAMVMGDVKTDVKKTASLESNEGDLNLMKEIDKNQWLEQYDKEEEVKHVEINPMKAAVQTLVVEEFDLDIEFSVAIGNEFIAILRTRSDLSASVKDWSTRLRAECCFSLDSIYYNERLDVWEPLLEPTYEKDTGKYRRWEIMARLTTAASHPIAKTDPNEILVDSQELDTFIHHQMSAAKEKHRAAEASVRAHQDHIVPMTVTDSRLQAPPAPGSDVSSNEDDVDIFLAPAGAIRPSVTVHKYKPDVIIEEEEEETIVPAARPLLMSGGPPVGPPSAPHLIVTQSSSPLVTVDPSSHDVADGAATPSLCASLADINIEEVDAKVDDKNTEDECMCTYLSLISRDKLLLNVTPQGLNVVNSVLETFTKKPNDSVLFEVLQDSPLTITNLLGIPACISLHKCMRNVDIKLENVRIAENMELATDTEMALQQPLREHPLQTFAGLTMPGLAALGGSKSSRSNGGGGSTKPKQHSGLLRQDLHLAVDGYLPIQAISFRRTQSRDFSAQPRNRREDHLCLRVKTQSKHGRRHVSIYSQLKIKNELQYPTEISYQEISYNAADNRHTSSNMSLGVIQPGDWLNIPAVVAALKKLQVKPITPESESSVAVAYSESNESLWWKDHLKLKSNQKTAATMKRTSSSYTQNMACSNQLKQSYAFKALWIPRVCLAEKCSGNCPSFDVMLKSTAEVKNFLPFDLKLDVHVSEVIGSQPSSYMLEAGVHKQINDSINVARQCDLIIPSYQGVSWRGQISIHDKMSETRSNLINMRSEIDEATAHGSATLAPKQYVSPTLTLFCHVTRKQSRGSQTQLSLTFFSQYWLSNTTGIRLQFRASGVRQSEYVETDDSSPVLFMPSSLNKKIQMRIPGYHWSKSFAIDAAGTVGTINCKNSDGVIKHRFMVETRLSNTQLTKIITIFPMFVVVNTLPYNIMFKEGVSKSVQARETPTALNHGAGNETDALIVPAVSIQATSVWTLITTGESKPFWPTVRKKPLSLTIRREESVQVSSAFPANVPQRTLLKISGEPTITADVSGGLGTEYFITLRPYQLGDAVVRIENLTEHTLSFTQGTGTSGNTISIGSSKSWLYYWPNPSGDRKLYWSLPGKKSKQILAKFSQDDSGVVKLQGKVTVYWQSYGDNLQRVITLSDNEQFQQIVTKKNQKEQATMFIFLALESAALSMINRQCLEISVLSINQCPSRWQVQVGKGGNMRWYDLGEKLSALIEAQYAKCSTDPIRLSHQGKELQIDMAKLQFVSPFSGDLKRESYPGVKIQYQTSEYSMAVQLAINHLQIDNQLPDAIFPVVFHPTKKSSLELLYNKAKPCIQVFLRRQFPIEGSTDTYKKATLSIEPFALRIDKGYILTLIDFISECRYKPNEEEYNQIMYKSHQEDIDYCMRDLHSDTKHKTDHSSGSKIYVEDMIISNITVRFSFSMLGVPHLADVENTQSSFGGDVVDFLLSSVGMTLTEVTDIEFSLGEFVLTNSVQTTDQLTGDLMTFYKSQAIRQGYVFVLGLDILGNPLGLVKDVRRGLKDFFHSANPLNYNKSSRQAILLGMKSAYGSIVGGLAGAGGKITESIGRGINTLSFDKRYIKSRLRRMKSQPPHFGGSLVLSAKTFGYALGSGVGGIVLQPKRGIEQEGAPGFFKGVGKGLTGILAKPIGGVFDSVSVLLDGFRRVTQYGTESVGRVRPPRHCIPSEGVARYHPYLAEGVVLVDDLSSYVYSSANVYWAHLELKRTGKRRRIALATTQNIYMLFSPWHTSHLRVLWSIPVDGLSKPLYQSKADSGTDSDLIYYLYNPNDDDVQERREIESEETNNLTWFFSRLKKLHNYTKATYKSTAS